MASTEKLPSGKYRGIYYDSAGKKRHTPAKDRKKDALADARDAEVKAKRQASAKKGALPGHTTWAEWVEVWWPTRGLEKSTDVNESLIRDRELLPVWGDEQLNQIGKADIQKWVNGLVTRKSTRGVPHTPGYVGKIYSVFRTSINAAVEEEVLLASPCVKIRLPKIPKTSARHFEHTDYETILTHLQERHREAVEFLYQTGLRPGEFAGLHWCNVYRETGWITVTDVLPRQSKTIKTRPKDEDSREVPLTTRALEILAKWERDIPPGAGCGMPHSDGKACRSDLVFRQRNGSPLSLTSITDVFGRALTKAKVTGTLYGLRHSFATKLAEAGVDAFEISRLMGHAKLEQSLTYVHRTKAARLRILGALGDPAASSLRLVGGTERGMDRGMSAPSSTLPDTPSEDAPQAGLPA